MAVRVLQRHVQMRLVGTASPPLSAVTV
jgi:hypothetical protein